MNMRKKQISIRRKQHGYIYNRRKSFTFFKLEPDFFDAYIKWLRRNIHCIESTSEERIKFICGRE